MPLCVFECVRAFILNQCRYAHSSGYHQYFKIVIAIHFEAYRSLGRSVGGSAGAVPFHCHLFHTSAMTTKNFFGS